MRTFDPDFHAEIKLTWRDDVFLSNQKENETNKQKLKLRAPAQIILVYGFTDFIVKSGMYLQHIVYITLWNSKQKQRQKVKSETILKKNERKNITDRI